MDTRTDSPTQLDMGFSAMLDQPLEDPGHLTIQFRRPSPTAPSMTTARKYPTDIRHCDPIPGDPIPGAQAVRAPAPVTEPASGDPAPGEPAPDGPAPAAQPRIRVRDASELLKDDAPGKAFRATQQQIEWTSTMRGTTSRVGVVVAHKQGEVPRIVPRTLGRAEREEHEDAQLCVGATRSVGAGRRARPEEPDEYRTCFERDRDRILHTSAFRRLAGKTQVFIFPEDHQRTRLTHAIEVAQVATAISRNLGLNVSLTEAIALGHDCGHGPGGHASEDAFSPYIQGGYHHAVWGADVALAQLNLCEETLDGIRNHSWSRPASSTPEGEVVSWADRFAYCTADLDDAIHAGIVAPDEIPESVSRLLGSAPSRQLNTLVSALTRSTVEHGVVGLDSTHAEALADLRAFNYSRVYARAESREQARAVVEVLQALVEMYIDDPSLLPHGVPRLAGHHCGRAVSTGSEQCDSTLTHSSVAHAAVAYVAGMTDRFAFGTATEMLNWPAARMPAGFDLRLFAGDDADGLAVTA